MRRLLYCTLIAVGLTVAPATATTSHAPAIVTKEYAYISSSNGFQYLTVVFTTNKALSYTTSGKTTASGVIGGQATGVATISQKRRCYKSFAIIENGAIMHTGDSGSTPVAIGDKIATKIITSGHRHKAIIFRTKAKKLLVHAAAPPHLCA